MKFTRKGLERQLGALFLILLFPGFFFYHTIIAFNIIPPILGGFFSPVSLVAALALTPLVAFGMFRRAEFFKIDIIFWLIIFLWCTSLILYQAFSSHFIDTKIEIIEWSLRGILANIVCYAIGRSLELESTNLKRILLGSLIGMLMISILNANDGSFYLKMNAADSESLATYQGFARSALIVCMLSLILNRRIFPTFIVFIFSLILLFLNGARSEFIFFLAAGIIYGWSVVFSTLKIRLLFVAVLTALAVFVFLGINELASFLPQTRIIQLVNIWESSSGESRIALSQAAWDVIQANPLFGSFASYASIDGVGGYAHNILSAWADFGFFGFALYITGLIIILDGGRKFIANKQSPRSTIILMFGVVLLVAYVASKDYTYMIFGFTAGLYAKELSRLRIQRKLTARTLNSISQVA